MGEIKLWINTALSTSIVKKRCRFYTDKKCEVHHYYWVDEILIPDNKSSHDENCRQ